MKRELQYRKVPNPLAHKVLDISLAAITAKTQCYAQAHLVHTHTYFTNATKVGGRIFLIEQL